MGGGISVCVCVCVVFVVVVFIFFGGGRMVKKSSMKA